ncbi:hypothetical protein Tco_0533214 [Tanacetum coccineum]
MDLIISLGQKNTLAEYMILSGANNRPPMLGKDLYYSWKSRMELYMQNREYERQVRPLDYAQTAVNDYPNNYQNLLRKCVTCLQEFEWFSRFVHRSVDGKQYSYPNENPNLSGRDVNLLSWSEMIKTSTLCLEATSFKYNLVSLSIVSVSFIGKK